MSEGRLALRPRITILLGGLIAVLVLIAGVAMALDRSEPTNDAAAIQTEKQQYADAVKSWDAAAEAAASDEPDPVASRPPFTPDEWPEGVLGKDEADSMEQSGYTFANVWMHSTGDEYLAVFAGSSVDSKYGVLLVQHVDPFTMRSEFERVETDMVGPVKISSVKGMRLAIQSTEGDASATYDVATDTLSASTST